jgi:hypothetical protein
MVDVKRVLESVSLAETAGVKQMIILDPESVLENQ